jgi:hypothetical protein
MVSHVNFQNVFTFLETFERGLNIVGYIPVIGTLGAFVRNHYAKIEAVAGAAFAVFATGLYVQGNPSRAYYIIGGTLFGHAILNEIRSYFEAMPGVALITTLPYDIIATVYVGGRFFSYI